MPLFIAYFAPLTTPLYPAIPPPTPPNKDPAAVNQGVTLIPNLLSIF